MTEPACVDTAVEYSVAFSLFSNVEGQEFHLLHLDPLRWLFDDSSMTLRDSLDWSFYYTIPRHRAFPYQTLISDSQIIAVYTIPPGRHYFISLPSTGATALIFDIVHMCKYVCFY